MTVVVDSRIVEEKFSKRVSKMHLYYTRTEGESPYVTWDFDSRRVTGGKVDAIDEKIDRLKPKGRRRSLYTEAQRKMCVACWRKANENAALRFSTNGRMTYEIAFNSFNHELEEVGIDKLAKFRAVLHSVQNMECEERRRRLGQ